MFGRLRRKRQAQERAIRTPAIGIDEPPPGPTVRRMGRRDLEPAEWIDWRASERPLDDWMLLDLFRMKCCAGAVAEINGVVVGFVLYDLGHETVHLVRLAVDPAFQRMGIGKALMERVKSRLSFTRRRIRVDVCETNVACQKFLAAQGFICDSVVHGVDGERDVLEFLYLAEKGE